MERKQPSKRMRCSSPFRVKWAVVEEFISVRCRRCEGCMRVRQYSWMARAAHEQAFAKNTWFITWTYRPSVRKSVQQRASELGKDCSHTVTQRLVAAAGEYVSDTVKRLRKGGFAFRYLCVPELHRDGFPHWHGLIHDLDGDLNHEVLTAAWREGWSVVKLVRDANALRYVTKYLSKERLGRVRASLSYGEPRLVLEEAAMIVSSGATRCPKGEGNEISLPVTKGENVDLEDLQLTLAGFENEVEN